MNVLFEILYQIIVFPIELIIEIVFDLIYRVAENPGIAIIAVSLIVNFLVLPLYQRSDALQDEERRRQKDMSKWTQHIKKTFHGDERFMILNTYYRQQNYSPIFTIRGSMSLLLQIPFFMAAYHFLSELSLLKGAPFLFIQDLGSEDQLLAFLGTKLNLLPILMTVINIISGIIYTKGFPLKDKLQLYGMAILFLLLLYHSPSGLVLYWTMNNIFSLLKNIFLKIIPRPFLVFSACLSVSGIAVFLVFFIQGKLFTLKRVLAVGLCMLLLQIPLLYAFLKGRINESSTRKKKICKNVTDNRSIFLGGLLLSILIGALIPSAVIVSSPAEFIGTEGIISPLRLIISSFCIAIGFFLFWPHILFSMMDRRMRNLSALISFIAAGFSIINYFFFSRNQGTLSIFLKLDQTPVFTNTAKVSNTLILIVCCFLLIWLWTAHSKITKYIYLVMSLSLAGMVIVNIWNIQKKLSEMPSIESSESKQASNIEPIIPLSREGKNVMVIMLDRAISGYIPYIFNEKRELLDEFSGFTYFPNTISFGPFTNFGVPGLFGGYEYTPKAMNERKDKRLADKYDEALKLMPIIFSENGYEVTVCDPPYAGYKWVSDLSSCSRTSMGRQEIPRMSS